MQTSSMTAARTIGLLLLLQMVLGPVINFGLLPPAISAPPGFLQNAAQHAGEVRLATLLMLIASASSVGMAIAFASILPVARRELGLWFLVLSVVGLALSGLEVAALRAMLALSGEFVRSGVAANAEAFEPLIATLRSVRHTAHYTDLLLASCGLLAFYAALLRLRLVPPLLASAGVVAAAVVVGAVVVPLMGGYITMALLIPLGLCQFGLAGWLLARGFAVEVASAREVHA